jgi:hypothetical protein
VDREGTVIEFLRFDGIGDPLRWIHHCECYFRVRRTPENKRIAYAAFYLLDSAQLWYHRLPDNGSPSTWEQLVLLVTDRFRPKFTDKPLSTPTVDSDAATREGVDDNNILFKATGEGDDALHMDDASVEHGVGNSNILVVSEGDDALPTDDDNGALRADGGSDVSSSVNATVPIISTIGAPIATSAWATSWLRSTAAVPLGGDDSILSVGSLSALRVGSDGNNLGVGNLNTDGRCSSGGSGALAVGKGGDILRARNNVDPTAGGNILNTCSGNGPDHVAIHDLLALRAFTTATPPLCAHKECHWYFALLTDHRSTSDLTHHQKSKMLLSLSEFGWGPPVSGWDRVNQKNKGPRLSSHFSTK